MNVLLVEPPYKNKYPPIGLMKIATFHKRRGDEVRFVKGLDSGARNQKWSRIYITTLFSFHWDQTIKTIKYYSSSVNHKNKVFVGGIMATLMAKELENELGIIPIRGQLNEKGKIGLKDDHLIDGMIPDYSILSEIDYKYPASNAYFSYMTRGCIRKCKFCAVNTLEPDYVPYIPLKSHIETIERKYGPKRNLLLLDNNVLASPDFDSIIDEIIDAGFYKGATLNGALRFVDFNQGIDARLLTKNKMKKLSELPLKPLRIAFDSLKIKDKYIQCIEWASQFGFYRLSNYILFNFNDTPEEFYERLRINVELNERLGTNIYSFPMKYVPINAKDRKYISAPNWNRRYLRGIQCILSATHGVVGPKKQFFIKAFGSNVSEFIRLISMPDDYIIYRSKHERNGAVEWGALFDSLSENDRIEFVNVVSELKRSRIRPSDFPAFEELLVHYK